MPERKAFLLRMDPEVLDALQRWAGDELRSLNAQIEYVLRRSLVESGRHPRARRGQRDRSVPAAERVRPAEGEE